MSEDNKIVEGLDTVTIEGVEYVIDDLSDGVKERLNLVRSWMAERDKVAELRKQKEAEYLALNREDVKLQLAISALGQEITSLVKEVPVEESAE